MLPQGSHATKDDSPLSGNHKYLKFEVDWELNKTKHLKELKFGNKLARPWIPCNAFNRHCIKADLFARISGDHDG